MKQIGFPKGNTPWNKGKKLTDVHKKRISKTLQGHDSPLKGTKRSPDVRKKISDKNKNKTPWNKGKEMPKSFGKKVSQGLKRFYASNKDK